MFKANICKTKERQFGQVPILKSFILKEPKFMDLWRSLLKTSLLYCNILIQGLFSSFFSFIQIKECTIYRGEIHTIYFHE